LAGFNKVALVWGCSQSFMTVIRRPAMLCSVVLWPLMASLAHNWSHCVWKLIWAHHLSPLPHPTPTHPPFYMRHSWYFVPRLKKTPANSKSRHLYNYLLVAIALLCFLCKSYTATVRHRRVMWQWIFQLVFSKI